MTRQLLEAGKTVIGTVCSTDKVADLIERYPDTFDCVILDVTDVPAVHRVIDDAWARHGRIGVVVSNAGYGLFGAAEELSDADIDKIIATDLTGSIQVIRTALPHLRAQGGCDPQLRGHAAVNLSAANSRELLIRVISSNLPFIGYPRTLNALAALEAAAPAEPA